MQVTPHAQEAGTYALAFQELELDWHWDGHEPVSAYVEREHPHLLRVYDAAFLAHAIESTRAHVAGPGTSPRDKP